MLRVVLAWAFSVFSLSLKGRIRTPTTTEHSCLNVECGVNKLTSNWRALALFQQNIWSTQCPWHILHCNSWQTQHWSSAIGYFPRRNLTLNGGGIIWQSIEMTKPDLNLTTISRQGGGCGTTNGGGLCTSLAWQIRALKLTSQTFGFLNVATPASSGRITNKNAIWTTCHHQISRRTTATCATVTQHQQSFFAPKCRMTSYNHCECLNPASGWLLQTLSHCRSFQRRKIYIIFFVKFHAC